jgi:tetratricopeptide (TPR) repeat protein
MKSKVLSGIVIFLFFLITTLSSQDLIQQAENLYKNEKYDDVLKICLRVYQIYPKSDWELTAHKLAARVYEKRNQLEKAIDEYKKIITNFTDNLQVEEAYFSIARLRMLMNQDANALKAYEAYLQKFPDGKYNILAIFNMGLIYKTNGNFTSALNKFNEIIRYYNNDLWFYNWAAIYSGHIYAEKGDYDKAIEYYDRVVKRDKDNSMYSLALLYKGRVFIQKKDYKTAQMVFQQILKFSSAFSEEAMIGLADAYYKAGEYELANEIYQSLIEIYPSTVWKNYVENELKKIKNLLKK